MENAQFLLDGTLILLLGATLFHALRLERALGVLKRDRAVLEALVAGFNDSTRAAEAGIEKLRGATDGAGRAIARQIEQAQRLRDDLGFLTERGDRLAERLEGGVRSARMFTDQHAVAPSQQAVPMPPARMEPQSRMEPQGRMEPPARMDAALRHETASRQDTVSRIEPGSRMESRSRMELGSRMEQAMPQQDFSAAGNYAAPPSYAVSEPAAGPRLRSEAERDLLRALRAAR